MKIPTEKFKELTKDLLAELDTDLKVTDTWENAEVTLEDGSVYVIYDYDKQVESVGYTVEETASYFNATFLERMTGIPSEAFEALVDHNEAVLAIIESTCGVKEFAEECIAVDGAGHFVAFYDGEEIELDGEYSAFRVD